MRRAGRNLFQQCGSGVDGDRERDADGGINKGDGFVHLIQYSKANKQWEKLKEGPGESGKSPVRRFKM